MQRQSYMEIRRILVVAEPSSQGEAALAVARRLAGGRALELRRTRGGDAYADVLREASAWQADLLVLGIEDFDSDDTPAQASSPLGVLVGSPCPLLVTRAGHERFAPRGQGFRRPVVGIDYSRFSAPAAQIAIALTEPDGAVDLLHAFAPQDPEEGVSPGLERSPVAPLLEDERARELRELFAFADRVDSPDVALECHVEIGNAAHRILEHVGSQENDLCVLGAHSRQTELERALGTVTDRILRHAPVPLILIPETLTARG